MMLAYPLLPRPICFPENTVQVLIVEHTAELRKILTMLREQIDGADGEFVLSKAHQPVPLEKEAIFLTDVSVVDLDAKKTLTKLRQEACAIGAAYEKEFCAMMEELNGLAGKISAEMDFDVCFSPVETREELIGLLNFQVDREALSFPEQILEYMKIQRTFFKKNLFIFYNLKSVLSSSELVLFYRNIQYEKLKIMLIEDVLRKPIKESENTYIIDEDLCIF